jgi:hypothetical protein
MHRISRCPTRLHKSRSRQAPVETPRTWTQLKLIPGFKNPKNDQVAKSQDRKTTRRACPLLKTGYHRDAQREQKENMNNLQFDSSSVATWHRSVVEEDQEEEQSEQAFQTSVVATWAYCLHLRQVPCCRLAAPGWERHLAQT